MVHSKLKFKGGAGGGAGGGASGGDDFNRVLGITEKERTELDAELLQLQHESASGDVLDGNAELAALDAMLSTADTAGESQLQKMTRLMKEIPQLNGRINGLLQQNKDYQKNSSSSFTVKRNFQKDIFTEVRQLQAEMAPKMQELNKITTTVNQQKLRAEARCEKKEKCSTLFQKILSFLQKLLNYAFGILKKEKIDGGRTRHRNARSKKSKKSRTKKYRR